MSAGRGCVVGVYSGTCVGEEDVEFEALPFYHLGTGAGTGGGQSTGDGVNSVQCTGKDEVFVCG